MEYSFGSNPESALGQTKAVHSERGFFTYSLGAARTDIQISNMVFQL
jgi:hypothetical protein